MTHPQPSHDSVACFVESRAAPSASGDNSQFWLKSDNSVTDCARQRANKIGAIQGILPKDFARRRLRSGPTVRGPFEHRTNLTAHLPDLFRFPQLSMYSWELFRCRCLTGSESVPGPRLRTKTSRSPTTAATS